MDFSAITVDKFNLLVYNQDIFIKNNYKGSVFLSIYSNFKVLGSKTIQKLILMLCIPVVITLIFAAGSKEYYINNYKSLIIANYSNELNHFLKQTENEMNLIINSANFFSANADIKYMLTTGTKPETDDYTHTLSAAAALKTVKNTSSLIDSIAIYNKNAGFVITQSGVYDEEEYFRDICPYENYPISYFKSYRSPLNSKKILAPSKLTDNSSQKIMVPLVLSSAGGIESGSLIIINVNVNNIFNEFLIYKFTPNTKIYMIDSVNNTSFGESVTENEVFEPYLIKKIKSSTYTNSDSIKVGGKRYLSITSTKRSNLWGYIYTVTVPYSDINNTVAKTALVMTIFALLLFIALFLFAVYGAFRIYTPWKSLITLIDSLNIKPSASHSTLWDYIGSSISDISHANEMLKHNLSITLPLSQEKYLIDILNGNTPPSDDELNKVIFRYDYFLSISMHVTINRAFTAAIPNYSGVQLMNEIYNAIYSVFASYFSTFTLPVEDNTLYLLLNLENDACSDRVHDVIENVKNLFAADGDKINISFYTGNIYKGTDGLRKTHNESMSGLMNSFYSNTLRVFTRPEDEYTFTMNSESILTNYLMAGYIDKAKEFLEEVFQNVSGNPQKSRQQVYVSVIMTFYKVMRTKNIRFEAETEGDEFEILHSIVSRPENDIKAYIIKLMDKITDSMQVSKTKIDIGEIVTYINENFTEDIYLEQLAQQYNTSTKYLSKRIKQYLNVSFKDYLTQLRIDKAKELLENSDIKIEELAGSVGFFNRTTFIRAFKLKVGLTPSEYRGLYRSKKK